MDESDFVGEARRDRRRRSSASSTTCWRSKPNPASPARPTPSHRSDALCGARRRQAAEALPHHRDGARARPRRTAARDARGAAIECVHAYSLIHDDLPAMDDDDLRRGRPTAHRAFDEATAILAGDALQTSPSRFWPIPRPIRDAETRAALCAGLARAVGLAGMVGGQMLDIEAENAAAPLVARGDRAVCRR